MSLKVIVEYGKNTPNVYKKVNEDVQNAIESMTGMCVMDVSTFVEDIVFPGETEGSDKEGSKKGLIDWTKTPGSWIGAVRSVMT